MDGADRPALQRFNLDNGLDVILDEDPSATLVAVYVSYRAGSARDPQQRSGLAHLCEHLSFLGSGDGTDVALGQASNQHPTTEHLARLVERMGGLIDARTSHDRTAYGSWMAPEMLDLALWVESRRMAVPTLGLSPSALAREQTIIDQELRQTFERPYGKALATVQRQVYGEQHPYGRMPIGTAEGIGGATEHDVEDFYTGFYQPCRAVLVVAGKVDCNAARRSIERYFGGIPNGPEPQAAPRAELPETPAIPSGVLEDTVPYSRAYVAWPAPSFGSGQRLLSGLLAKCWAGRDHRLQQRLVGELGVAQSVEGLTVSMRHAMTLIFSATGQRGVAPSELREALLDALRTETRRGVEPHVLTKVRRRAVTDYFIDQRHLQNRADRLAQWAVFGADPQALDADVAQLQAVQAEDLEVFASQICRPNRSTRLTVVPQ